MFIKSQCFKLGRFYALFYLKIRKHTDGYLYTLLVSDQILPKIWFQVKIFKSSWLAKFAIRKIKQFWLLVVQWTLVRKFIVQEWSNKIQRNTCACEKSLRTKDFNKSKAFVAGLCAKGSNFADSKQYPFRNTTLLWHIFIKMDS